MNEIYFFWWLRKRMARIVKPRTKMTKASKTPKFLQISLWSIEKLTSRFFFTVMSLGNVGGTFCMDLHPMALLLPLGQSPNTTVVKAESVPNIFAISTLGDRKTTNSARYS